MKYAYKLQGVCPQTVEFDLEKDVVKNVSFAGGCNGNLKAISKLVDGMSPAQIIDVLEGNTCDFRNTSCGDQLAKALKAALEKAGEGVHE